MSDQIHREIRIIMILETPFGRTLLTQGMKETQAKNMMFREAAADVYSIDAITGPKTRTSFGGPN
jgi:hypothetical protein